VPIDIFRYTTFEAGRFSSISPFLPHYDGKHAQAINRRYWRGPRCPRTNAVVRCVRATYRTGCRIGTSRQDQ